MNLRWRPDGRRSFIDLLVATLLVIGGISMLGLLWHFLSSEVFLDLRGVTARAVVERIYAGSKFDVVHIRFRPSSGASPVRTTVQSLFGATPHPGSRLAIQYDPDNPSRAREAGNHDPLLMIPFCGAVLYMVFRSFHTPREPENRSKGPKRPRRG